MPYTANSDDLPDYVKKLPEAKRAQWAAVWNSARAKCLEDGGTPDTCEAPAFAQANGIVMKESADEALAEAVTLKARAQALMRDMEAITADRALPESVRKEIEDVRTALRRTWADLESDGAEPASDGESKAEGADAKEKPEAQEKAGAVQLPPDGELVSERLGEAAEGVELLSEGELPVGGGGGGPLTLKVQLIRPGFGNKKDNHYYPAETLKKYARAFRGSKMYETDHVPGAKSNRTWVSTVRDIIGFSDEGAPIAEVVAHDPDFIQRVRNLAKGTLVDGKPLLSHMACSIQAGGKIRWGKIDGKETGIVEVIDDDPLPDVDWVTRAGAGGQALAIMSEAQSEPESNGGTVMAEETQQEPAVTPEPVQEKEPVVERLSETDAQAVLAEAQCNEAIKERLAAGSYANAAALKAAIVAEVEYLKKVTGAGRVTDLGESAKAQPKQVTLAEVEDRVQKVNQKWGFGPARKPETKENQK
jgi:hypothetical protein